MDVSDYTRIELPPFTREMALEKTPEIAWPGRNGVWYGQHVSSAETRAIADYHYNGGSY